MVTFTGEIRNGKLHFLCSDTDIKKSFYLIDRSKMLEILKVDDEPPNLLNAIAKLNKGHKSKSCTIFLVKNF